MASLGWLLAFLVFLGVELWFCCLTSLWFAAGAAGAFAISLGGASVEAQLAGFAAISFFTLILIRPAAFFIHRHVTLRHRRAGGKH